jgi:hypothetical protein
MNVASCVVRQPEPRPPTVSSLGGAPNMCSTFVTRQISNYSHVTKIKVKLYAFRLTLTFERRAHRTCHNAAQSLSATVPTVLSRVLCSLLRWAWGRDSGFLPNERKNSGYRTVTVARRARAAAG